MTDGFRYNRFDVSSSTQRTSQQVWRKVSLYGYDFIKFIFSFIRTLIKEVFGR